MLQNTIEAYKYKIKIFRLFPYPGFLRNVFKIITFDVFRDKVLKPLEKVFKIHYFLHFKLYLVEEHVSSIYPDIFLVCF